MSISFWQIIILVGVLLLYFLPYIIAKIRKIRNSTSVFWLNLFLGWTGIGFLVLVFYASLTSVTKEQSVTDFLKNKKN